ncbi:DUF1579 domain-containing protein [Arthrobacter sp. 24S4-2]|uniref:DUF1579 family protein n=1 Tax=Arthrobacter sp. 24S4-2 TaxID=2575374 RepID=UPI0010C7881F|nr:DUF1579 family protein [Arthrobacter sp. 24S4-2]QCO99548.1 DUF1579 domain-containing protein [Arthrobacter sp. 24S4-2]
MTIIETMAPFVGSWQGHNRLRFMPTDEYQESAATASVKVTAGEFVTIEYAWEHEGKPQNGLLLLGSGPVSGSAAGAGSGDSETGDSETDGETGDGETGVASGTGAVGVWVDSFHSGPEWMNFAGDIGVDGVVRLTGWYAAPSGPDWGWQIHVEPGDGNGGRITMHNMVPGHEPYQVVEAVYRRHA